MKGIFKVPRLPRCMPRQYVSQLLSPELNAALEAMFTTLHRFQQRVIARGGVKAHTGRRYVVGLRETLRAASSGRAKLIVLAPDLEACEAAGGLDDRVRAIVERAQERGVLLAFALS
ncbi:MAG: ribosomal L7Ae/L30e/S12e/Gadd45 family protein, partial [Thermomonas sp.]